MISGNGSLIPGLPVSGPAHADEYQQAPTLNTKRLTVHQQRQSGMYESENTAQPRAVFPFPSNLSHSSPPFPEASGAFARDSAAAVGWRDAWKSGREGRGTYYLENDQ